GRPASATASPRQRTARRWRRRLSLAGTSPPLRVLADGGPQAVAVQHLDVAFHRLAGAARDHGLALVVNVEHQLFRLRPGIPEYVLEHVSHIGHEVDRIVPDDRQPWLVRCYLFR